MEKVALTDNNIVSIIRIRNNATRIWHNKNAYGTTQDVGIMIKLNVHS